MTGTLLPLHGFTGCGEDWRYVFGERLTVYPVELLRGIPNSAPCVVANGGHGPIFGEQAAPFVRMAAAFLG